MQRIIIIILFFVFFVQQCFSQKTDSLKKLFRPNLPDTEQCNVLNKIGYSFYINDGQLDSSLVYLQKAKTISFKTNSIKHQVNSLLNVALVIREKGSFEKAMEDYFEALKLAEKINNKRMISNAYSGIAVVYSFQKDQIKAREYYQKAMDIAKETNNDGKMASLNNNIGLTYMEEKNYPLSLKYMQIALTLNKKVKNDNGTAAAAENIGLLYNYMKNYDLAMTYYIQAYKIWTSRNDVYSTAINLSYMAMTFNNIKQYKRACDTATKALQMAQTTGAISTQIDLHSYLSESYKNLKNYEKALYHFTRTKQLADSVKSDENIKAFTETQLKYSFYKQQLQDSLSHVLTVNKKEEQIKAEKTIKYFSFGAIAVFIILLFFLFKGYREKQEANKLIIKQKEIVEEKQKEIIDSINYARRIQTALLAGEKILSENLNEHFILYLPKDIVSGDFYWATKRGNKLFLAVCDSTGHGVPGAFMSLLNIGFLREAINEKNIESPEEVFNQVRQRLIDNISVEGQKDGFDGILICIEFTFNKQLKLTYAAANVSPVIIRGNNLIKLQCDRMPVGEGEIREKFTLHHIDCNPGDVLYLYSDGYADQFGGPKAKKFKYKQLNNLLLDFSHLPMNQQKQLLEKSFNQWKGDLEQVDDVLVAGIRL